MHRIRANKPVNRFRQANQHIEAHSWIHDPSFKQRIESMNRISEWKQWTESMNRINASNQWIEATTRINKSKANQSLAKHRPRPRSRQILTMRTPRNESGLASIWAPSSRHNPPTHANSDIPPFLLTQFPPHTPPSRHRPGAHPPKYFWSSQSSFLSSPISPKDASKSLPQF